MLSLPTDLTDLFVTLGLIPSDETTRRLIELDLSEARNELADVAVITCSPYRLVIVPHPLDDGLAIEVHAFIGQERVVLSEDTGFITIALGRIPE